MGTVQVGGGSPQEVPGCTAMPVLTPQVEGLVRTCVEAISQLLVSPFLPLATQLRANEMVPGNLPLR